MINQVYVVKKIGCLVSVALFLEVVESSKESEDSEDSEDDKENEETHPPVKNRTYNLIEMCFYCFNGIFQFFRLVF